MSERLYAVYVSQALEVTHEVIASSKKEARQIILDLTRNNLVRDDPRIVASYDSGVAGEEHVARVVDRLK